MNTQSSRNPDWWKSDDTSAWDRVKEALRRDWEQTRNDFSGGKKGQDLNQNVDDTVAQAVGKRPIPPPTVANPLDADELHAKVKKAQKEMRAAEKEYEEEAEDTARKLRRDWDSAEHTVRYGYAAARHYGGRWSPEVENRVRTEWANLNPDARWEDVQDEVRFAWERAAAAQSS
jgi:hypothetical protein